MNREKQLMKEYLLTNGWENYYSNYLWVKSTDKVNDYSGLNIDEAFKQCLKDNNTTIKEFFKNIEI